MHSVWAAIEAAKRDRFSAGAAASAARKEAVKEDTVAQIEEEEEEDEEAPTDQAAETDDETDQESALDEDDDDAVPDYLVCNLEESLSALKNDTRELQQLMDKGEAHPRHTRIARATLEQLTGRPPTARTLHELLTGIHRALRDVGTRLEKRSKGFASGWGPRSRCNGHPQRLYEQATLPPRSTYSSAQTCCIPLD